DAYETAIVRAQKYAKTLERDREFGVVGSRVGGSIGKGTAIKPVSDVDLYLYLDEEAWQSTRGEALRPSTIIGRLHARVAQRLHFEIDAGHATIRRQGHSVGIQFRKTGSVDIDVVPALVQGGDIREARIPRRGTDAFVATSVERQLELLGELDTRAKYLRRGIRLLKLWKRDASVNLHSYAVEVIAMFVVTQGCKRTALGVFQAALEFMGTTNMRTPVFIERYYDYRPHRRRVCTILDPAMPDNDLGAHLGSGAGDRLGAQARRSLRRLEKAARLAEKGRLQGAADEVSEAFGEPGLITWHE
ncbi:MAG TPA: nucleotidyltransferase, partial [Nannocystis sp.]